MSTTPAVVIVPGSFAPAKMYNGIASKFQSAGFDTVEVVELPSVGREGKHHPPTLAEDTAHIATVVEKLADAGKDVVIVPHSYGGIPASESVKGLTKEERTAQGKKGGIIGLVYTTSVVPAEGESLETTLPGIVGSFIKVEAST
jgi:surfactin synthase thioesterase subunit